MQFAATVAVRSDRNERSKKRKIAPGPEVAISGAWRKSVTVKMTLYCRPHAGQDAAETSCAICRLFRTAASFAVSAASEARR